MNKSIVFSDDLEIAGALEAGSTSSSSSVLYHRFVSTAGLLSGNTDISNLGDVFVQNDLKTGGTVYATKIDVIGTVDPPAVSFTGENHCPANQPG